jgi:hypothetical protein
VLLEFGVEVDPDPATGRLTLRATPTQTTGLPRRGVWDFELTETATGDTRTYLKGAVVVDEEVTRA